jgi:hypothetical protein
VHILLLLKAAWGHLLNEYFRIFAFLFSFRCNFRFAILAIFCDFRGDFGTIFLRLWCDFCGVGSCCDFNKFMKS